MNINRAVWKNKRGKVVGVNLHECGSDMFDIVNKIRTNYEGKQVDGCFCVSELSNRKFTWNYGVYRNCQLFCNKVILTCPLDYEYIYLFGTGKIYKVEQEESL